MSTTIHADPVPLRLDAAGALRVGVTRVTLDTVLAAYRAGASAEEIAVRYDSLALADVHAAIAYCLRHPADVEAYLAGRRTAAEEGRAFVQARQGVQAVRERLAARVKPGPATFDEARHDLA